VQPTGSPVVPPLSYPAHLTDGCAKSQSSLEEVVLTFKIHGFFSSIWTSQILFDIINEFIQQIFTEHFLCSRHSDGYWGYSSE
jgi:hypothetical protein